MQRPFKNFLKKVLQKVEKGVDKGEPELQHVIY